MFRFSLSFLLVLSLVAGAKAGQPVAGRTEVGVPLVGMPEVGGRTPVTEQPAVAEQRGRITGYGFDTITPPEVYAGQLAGANLTGSQGTWMRVRGLVEGERGAGSAEQGARTVQTDRDGLRALRERGIKTAVFLRWAPSSWVQGVRRGGGHRLPVDLREVYERGRALGETYGDLVDVWEIENEPDIDFVADNPETYAAFQKAVYLGLHAGAQTASTAAAAFEASLREKVKFKDESGVGESDLNLKLSSSTRGAITTPRVVMAPLALPPGPYLERLWANGIGSYTDGFNFHYYGYAADFTGVYEQFRDAVATLGAMPGVVEVEDESLRDRSGSELNLKLKTSSDGHVLRTLPVFITEYGYGLLDAEARDSVEGRVRQWRWFASVVAQVRALRPEGPMAFLVEPYYEADLNEFGLTMKTAAGFMAVGGRQLPDQRSGLQFGEQVAATRAEGDRDARPLLQFEPGDFGAKRAQPWMERIGQAVGGSHASPALAYLWDYAERHAYRARDWSVRAAPASLVVIDLVAGRGMTQMKSAGGYELSGHDEVSNYVISGSAKWVLYNFSTEAITGRLEITGEGVASQMGARTVTLAAGERQEIVDELGVQAQVFAGRALRAVFVADDARVARAVWATRLFPEREWMVNKPVAGFDFTAEAAARQRTTLAKRKTTEGEPHLKRAGRWLATDGVRVEERDGVWRFLIDHLPAEPLRPAAVELPLPKGFVFAAGTTLVLERRKAPREELGAAPAPTQIKLKDEVEDRSADDPSLNLKLKSSTPARMKPRAGVAGDMMDVYFRTENGNLYQTWPRLRVTKEWTGYSGQAENFTMAFFGRAKLPWRFAENRPAALVFFLRPSELPAMFEVRGAQIERVERAE